MLASAPAVLRGYGNYVATRYREYDNIIWMHGGDTDAADDGADDEVNAIAQGIMEVDLSKLHTSHCDRQNSAIDCYNEPWLQVNNTYSDCEESAARTKNDYDRLPVIPFFYAEGTYENEGASDRCLRSQAYWSVLGGSTGHFFGNNPIWLMDPGWDDALGDAGSRSMTHFGNLFLSRPWFRLIPDYDQNVVSGDRGDINDIDYVAAARADNGEVIIVYFADNRTVSVDLSTIAGPQANVWWYEPSSGDAELAEQVPAVGSRNFTPPSNADWVLVIDNADAEFTPPGEVPVVLPGDTAPPTLVSAEASDPNQVTVTFSEAMERVSVETAANYVITPAVTVTESGQMADLSMVVLTTSSLSENVVYTLTVDGVLDLALVPNEIVGDSAITFQFIENGDSDNGRRKAAVGLMSFTLLLLLAVSLVLYHRSRARSQR
jgi:hypothetical protein